jgi:hypothetical protein
MALALEYFYAMALALDNYMFDASSELQGLATVFVNPLYDMIHAVRRRPCYTI